MRKIKSAAVNAQVVVVGRGKWGVPGASPGQAVQQLGSAHTRGRSSGQKPGGPVSSWVLRESLRPWNLGVVSLVLWVGMRPRETGPLGWRWGCRLLASGNGGKEATMEMLSPGALVGSHLPTESV